MNHSDGMSGVDGPRQGLDQLRRRPRTLGRAFEVLGQAAAGHKFQDKVRPARGLADIVDLNDVGVPQARDHRGLGAKASQFLRASVGPGQHHLERHGAIEADLSGLVDDAHASASQLTHDFVAGHLRPFAARPKGACRLPRSANRRPDLALATDRSAPTTRAFASSAASSVLRPVRIGERLRRAAMAPRQRLSVKWASRSRQEAHRSTCRAWASRSFLLKASPNRAFSFASDGQRVMSVFWRHLR